MNNDDLIAELFGNNVTIEQIFARYYELEEMAYAQYHIRPVHPLTVYDAQLVGLTNTKPIEEKPF